MNEAPKLPAPLPPSTGATPTGKNLAPTAAAPTANPPANVPAQSGGTMAKFGGHKGGGKKRADGLVAGSQAAIDQDKKFNSLRMFIDRERERRQAGKGRSDNFAEEFNERIRDILPGNRESLLEKFTAVARMGSPLPPTLPPSSAPAQGQNPAGAGAANPLPAAAFVAAVVPPVVSAALPGNNAPTFVTWTVDKLTRAARLLTKIGDKFRKADLMGLIKRLRLSPERLKEAEQRIEFRKDLLDDWNNALANATAIELNKRRVGGAENAHWIDVGITGATLINEHLEMREFLEKLVLENAANSPASAAEQK